MPAVSPSIVVFDLGKVLLDFDYTIAGRRLAARATMPAAEVHNFLNQSPLLHRYETGLMTRQELFDEVRHASGFSGSLEEFGGFFADIFTEMPEMTALHAELRRQGIPTYIFSNTNDLAMEHIRRNFPFFAHFDGYILSYQIRSMKPDARIYEALEAMAGKRGPEILYLDDRPENVAAGAARGWQVILQTDPAKSRAAIEQLGLLGQPSSPPHPANAMSKPVKSQWDFGELFPTEPIRRVLSVSELTTQVKHLLEKQMGSIWVSGEITNLRRQNSGHIYFTLKDAAAQLSCVLFRKESMPHRDLLQDGRQVLLQGDVTVYEARGQYQLVVRAVELQGVGVLQLRFEQLKQRLAAEGWFATERKRPLPPYPCRIGLVTSPTGAAIRDVLHVIQRRNPGLEIILVPCRVQGEGAAAEIAKAIRWLNEFNSPLRPPPSALDLILLTRGGGSLEDLWAFNEEMVARAIFESAIPVVSAVGHEIDYTIADFVADLRAATPSAAAELITEGVFASRQFVAEAAVVMNFRVRQRLVREREDFESVTQRMRRSHPRRWLDEHAQRLDDLQDSLLRSAKQSVRAQLVAWHHLATRLRGVRPGQLFQQRRERLQMSLRQLREHGQHQLANARNHFATHAARLRLLGPEQVLSRGYSITMDAATCEILLDAKRVKPGQRMRTRLKQGEVVSRAGD